MPIKRNLSISTSFAYDIPIEKQIPLIAKAGFNFISLGGSRKHFDCFSRESCQKLLELLSRYGLKMDTIHGPLTGIIDIEEMKKLAEATRELKAPVIVLHCSPFEFPENELVSRLLNLKKDIPRLEKLSKETGVVFALENMVPGAPTELVREALKVANPEYVGFCYDSSHDQIDGPRPFSLLKELKDKLVAVHLSDRIRPYTDHVIPGEGFIRWEELCPLLKSCNIRFPLLFEIATTNSREKDPEKFLALAYEKACGIWDKVAG